mgnify:CR=1 FL=1|jgi:predicted Fe-Mo cluster-binding NifX family protein
MRIAVPLFGTRISPRLDCAAAFLLVESDGGEVSDMRTVRPPDDTKVNWQRELTGLGVDTLLCGGIHRQDFFALRQQGLRVFAGHSGEALEFVKRLLSGDLDETIELTRGSGAGRGHRAGSGRSDSGPHVGSRVGFGRGHKRR